MCNSCKVDENGVFEVTCLSCEKSHDLISGRVTYIDKNKYKMTIKLKF
jgi:hypothetical protein